jgi:hypothetical protein
MANNTETIKKVIELRNDRQIKNNKLAFDALKDNSKNPNINHINKQALNRLLEYTNYKNIDEIIKDKDNYEEIIMKIISLYIAKNSSRQGSFDEEFQLETINKLQDYDIIIKKDGKQKPIKSGGLVNNKNNTSTNELKSIDFTISYKTQEIGYIMAKVSVGGGGHQDNVLHEIIQFLDWSIIQIKNDDVKKVYLVLYDSQIKSKLFDDIKKKYKNNNIILTDSKNFKNDFLDWFNKNYK